MVATQQAAIAETQINLTTRKQAQKFSQHENHPLPKILTRGESMRDFFKPMRRKLALVTVTLLVTTSYLWVRSFQFPGGMSINVDLGPSYVSTHFFGATYKGFEWIRDKRLASSLDVGERERIGHSLGDFDLMNDDDGCKTIWRVNLLGFVTGAAFFSTGTLRVDLVTLVIPYWMAFISLALLSAWLLLSKPRPTKPGGPPQS